MHLQLYMGNTCGLRCSYCVSNMHDSKNQRLPLIIDEIGIEKYLEILGKLIAHNDKIKCITMTAQGECSESPYFEPILIFLMNETKAQIIIQTNLMKITKVVKALRKVKEHERIIFVASFHYGIFLDRRMETGKWHNNLKKLSRFKCNFNIVTPITPKVIEKRQEYYAHLEIMDIDTKGRATYQPVELSGRYEGKDYPAAYCDIERMRLVEIMQRTGAWRESYMPKKNLNKLCTFFKLKGMLCNVNSQTAMIGINGDITYCQNVPSGTNIRSIPENYQLYDEQPMVCTADLCTCPSYAIEYCIKFHGHTVDDYYEGKVKP